MPGNQYEGFYFQSNEGPFADPVFRQAFAMSIDREAVFQQIYGPIFDAATGEPRVEGGLLQCGPIVEGPYCFDSFADNVYDPEGAAALLTTMAGRRTPGLLGQGRPAPEIRWMINTGNLRRENTQAFLIPLMQEAGFNVVTDNGTAEEVFQQKLPTLDYDMAMYINTVAPDPQYLTPSSPAPRSRRRRTSSAAELTGWCNEEASAALEEADRTLDESARPS